MTLPASHRARAKSWEQEVAGFVGGWRSRPSNPDLGDVAGVPGVVVECKAQGKYELHQWILQARRAAKAAGASLALVAVKKQGKRNPADGLWLIDPACIPYILRLVREDQERIQKARA